MAARSVRFKRIAMFRRDKKAKKEREEGDLGLFSGKGEQSPIFS